MDGELPIFPALYRLGSQFKPEIERLGARLLKVTFELDGRSITFNFDEREHPPEEPGGNLVKKTPPLPPADPNTTPPPAPVRPKATAADILGTRPTPIPLPPPPPTRTIAPPAQPVNKRWEPVEGITPLRDDEPCPVGKVHKGKLMRDVPPDFLDWLYGQTWFRKKFPQCWAYVVNHRDVLGLEMTRQEHSS